MNLKNSIKSLLSTLIIFLSMLNVNVQAESVNVPQPIDNNELQLLYRVVSLEAYNHHDEGIQAVASTIVNRVLSDDFPNTYTEVVSQNGQFATYSRATNWFAVDENVIKNVDHVLNNGVTHNLRFFWSEWYYINSGRWDDEAVNIGGNIFFEF